MSEDEDDEMERSSIKLDPNHLGLNSLISECAAKRGKVLGKMSVSNSPSSNPTRDEPR